MDAFADALNIEPEKENALPVQTNNSPENEDLDYVRNNLKIAISECLIMMPELRDLAVSAQSGRIYDAVANFMATFTQMNEALINSGVNQKKADVMVERAKQQSAKLLENKNTPKNFEGAAYHGTTEELLALILKNNKEEPLEAE